MPFGNAPEGAGGGATLTAVTDVYAVPRFPPTGRRVIVGVECAPALPSTGVQGTVHPEVVISAVALGAG